MITKFFYFYTFCLIASVVATFSSCDPKEETEEETEEEVIEEEIPVKTKFSVDTSKAKKTKEDKFDSLFEEKTTELLPLEDDENLPIVNK